LRLGHKSIDALISKIKVEMLADGASLNLCRYSNEPFTTNEIIRPHWGMTPFHAPTLATFGAVLALLAAGTFGLTQATPRSARTSRDARSACPRRGCSAFQADRPARKSTAFKAAIMAFRSPRDRGYGKRRR
jgi:hypothetical protein